MTILAPNGKPVNSTRKVGIRIEMLDQKPGDTGTQVARMSYLLDTNDRFAVARLLDAIKEQTLKRLEEIGFFGPTLPSA